MKNRVLMEKPDVSFNYKYILLANRDYSVNPIICSTFKTYKDNEIKDDCILTKVLSLCYYNAKDMNHYIDICKLLLLSYIYILPRS